MPDGTDQSEATAEPASPADVVAKGDPGDETARRYAYQWCYTAIMACALLDAESGIAEVYCEHHEDLLLKRSDGKFHGIQVKTRQLGSDPWKATDDDIVRAVAKFAQLEHDYSSMFARFTVATNHQFYTAKPTGTNLPHLLDLARAAAGSPGNTKLNKYIRSIEKRASISAPTVLGALKKTECDHNLPKLDNVKQELCEAICCAYAIAGDWTLALLKVAANSLVAEVQRAASLDHTQCIPRYLSAAPESLSTADEQLIAGKRLTLERVSHVLGNGTGSPALLTPGDIAPPQPPTDGRTKLEKKLNVGGLSVVSVNAAKDLAAAALNQYLEWQAKLGPERARKQYAHIKALVLRDCADAYETAKADDVPFGRAMLTDLRQRFRHRRGGNGATLFDCLDEHLEGYAFELTNACTVWWSKPFNIEEGK